MTNRSPAVERFMQELDHPRKDSIAALRSAILDANDDITEQIKWDAPSFGIAGEDRVTFRLQPRDVCQLVFHRGVKVKDSADFAFEDNTGLLKWAAPDRTILPLDALDVSRDEAVQTTAIVTLVNRWMDATT